MELDQLPKAGQVVFCGTCNHDLYRFTRDAQHGDIASRELLEAIGDQQYPAPDKYAECHRCGTPVNVFKNRPPKESENDLS